MLYEVITNQTKTTSPETAPYVAYAGNFDDGKDGVFTLLQALALVITSYSIHYTKLYDGYKTVLVEFDLRKPAITQQLEAKQEPGASTYISGAAAFEDIIQKTPYDNLHYVAAGATPPNPTELTASEKTAEMRNNFV